MLWVAFNRYIYESLICMAKPRLNIEQFFSLFVKYMNKMVLLTDLVNQLDLNAPDDVDEPAGVGVA